MSPTRKVLFTTLALLAGLVWVTVSTQLSSDRPVPQQENGSRASSATSQITPQRTPAPKNPSNRGTAKTGAIIDEKLTELEQKSLWQALSEARREVREIPEAWADRKENLDYDFYALHPKQQLTARFGAGEVQFVSSVRTYSATDTGWEAKMSLQAFAGRDVAADATAEKVAGSRVEYQRAAGLTEWFDNGTEAMEHGFTVAGRPAHLAANDEVVLTVGLDGLKAAERDAEGQSLAFRDGEREVLRYEKLLVFDAEGKELSARMEPTADGFLIAYHDTGATYPVTVDPLIVNQEAKFNRVDGAPNDQFGQSVGISGNTVVVGSAYDDDGGIDSGSAYVFIRNGGIWTQQAKLIASDAAAQDQFGLAVAISGDSVVVGAHLEDDGGTDSGSAYVFKRSGSNWSQQDKFTALDVAANDRFGQSVSISGDTAVVGVFGDDDGGTDSGSAYVFTRSGTTWNQQTKLIAPDAAENDLFGKSVSISGDTAVVGAVGDDEPGFDSGSAYVFTGNGGNWTEQQKLIASDASVTDRFGQSVSISGETVVIGAYGDFQIRGSAYVFTRSGGNWSQQAKLTASDAAAQDQLGWSVSVSGGTVVVGAYLDDNANGGTNSGSAYAFTRSGTTWTQQAKLTASDGAADDQFGFSVAVSGDTVVAGAHLDDDGGTNSGSVYVYRLAVPAVRKLLVADRLGNPLASGGTASPFPDQPSGTSETHLFTVTNAGELGLNLQSISLEGTNSSEFSLGVPSISNDPDLAQGGSLTFTVTFNPVGGSGARNATLLIHSDDPDSPYSANLSGLGFSNSGDADSDGMSDWAEHGLRNFGFIWDTAQPALVSEFYENASRAGLVTLDQVGGMKAGTTLLDVNLSTNRAKFAIELKQSNDLVTPFAPIVANPARISVDAQGRIVCEVDAPAGKRFYLMEVKP